MGVEDITSLGTSCDAKRLQPRREALEFSKLGVQGSDGRGGGGGGVKTSEVSKNSTGRDPYLLTSFDQK